MVDDHPPYEPDWNADVPDPWDQPVWTAAVRGNANVVVTENLKDGPPPSVEGVREHRGIVYLHPDELLRSLDVYATLIVRPRVRTLDSAEPWSRSTELETTAAQQGGIRPHDALQAGKAAFRLAWRESMLETVGRGDGG